MGPKTARSAHVKRMFDEHDGVFRVGYRQDRADLKGGTTWKLYRPGDQPYHLRTIAKSQIVFDLGDHDNWQQCRLETHALWFALNQMKIPWVGALSGGKGTHTEVLGPKRCDSLLGEDDWRNAATAHILERANEIYAQMTSIPFAQIEADHRLLSPGESNQLVREYGARKSVDAPHFKCVWAKGGGVFPMLPPTREEAYGTAMFGPVFPDELPRCESLSNYDASWMRAVGEGACPVGPKCLNRAPEDWMGCADCPMVNL